MNFDLKEHTILLAVSGSRAYGLHHADSDVDVKGVAIPPSSFLLGVLNSFEQATSGMDTFLDLFSESELASIEKEKLEGTVYNLNKFCKLALEANPSIWDVLFCRDEEVRYITPLGEKLRENRDLFISVKAKHTYSGYAWSQLQRIQTHRKWLMGDTPEIMPNKVDYNLFTGITEKEFNVVHSMMQKVVDGWEIDLTAVDKPTRVDLLAKYNTTLSEMNIAGDSKWNAAGRTLGFNEDFLAILETYRCYKRDVDDWKKYQHWKQNRNPARAELEAKYGFDLKHAGHLVRLLSCAKILLTTGKVQVYCEPETAELVKAVKDGHWSFEQLLEWANKTNEELNIIYANKTYLTPYKPERKKIDLMCQELFTTAFNMR